MANPVSGQINLSVDITSTTETGWKQSQTAVRDAVKTALEGVEVKNVEIDAATLSFNQQIVVIEADPEKSEGDKEEPDNDGSDEPKKKKDKKEKGDKAEKAAKGKKKGRK